MPSKYRQATPANIDALIAQIDTDVTSVDAGWTKFSLNATGGAPAASRIRQEIIYRINGTVAQPTRYYVAIARAKDAGVNGQVTMYGAEQVKGPFTITNIARAGGNVATITAPGHTFAVGEVPVVNGTGDESFHDGNGSETAQATISSIVAGTSFTYTQPIGGGVVGSTPSGGTCFSLLPLTTAGGRTVALGAGMNLTLADSPMSVFYYYDEFRVAGIILQGGNAWVFRIGQTGRDHIPATCSDTAFTSGAVVSPAAPATINLDRACPNLKIGQPIWIIDVTSGVMEKTTIISKPSNTQITATLVGAPTGGSYASGALVGWDPCPGGTLGRTGVVTTTAALEGYLVRFSRHLDASRGADGTTQLFNPRVDMDTTIRTDVAPDAALNFQLRDIVVDRATAGTTGIRGREVGLFAVPLPNAGGPVDQDLMRVGATTDITVASDPPFDHKVFVSQKLASFGVAVGPNAIP